MSSETAEKLAACHKRLAAPLAYVAPPEDPKSIVETYLLPENMRSQKHYVYAHMDGSRPERSGRFPAITTHVQYFMRPKSTPPKEMQARRKAGFTVEWFENELRELQTGWLVFVDAELIVPNEDRAAGHGAGPKISVGSSTLKRRGEEYRSEDPAKSGDVTRYRWLEDDKGGLRVWLSFSHSDGNPGSFWKTEEERCRGYLQALL
jgi:hypothetical protein